MLCIQCSCDEFSEITHTATYPYKEENITITHPAMKCKECGWITASPEQADVVLNEVLRIYNEIQNQDEENISGSS